MVANEKYNELWVDKVNRGKKEELDMLRYSKKNHLTLAPSSYKGRHDHAHAFAPKPLHSSFDIFSWLARFVAHS